MNGSTELYSKSSASLLEEQTSIQLVPFQKVWIMDETVAAVQAGVWNALSHDASCVGRVLYLICLQSTLLSCFWMNWAAM